MKGILLLSHGELCNGMVNSIELITGRAEKLKTVSLCMDSDLDDFSNAVEKSIDELDDGEGVLIIVDIVSGTPYNTACRFLESKNIEIITGMSMPIVITAIFERDLHSLEELSDVCINSGKDSIKSVRALL